MPETVCGPAAAGFLQKKSLRRFTFFDFLLL